MSFNHGRLISFNSLYQSEMPLLHELEGEVRKPFKGVNSNLLDLNVSAKRMPFPLIRTVMPFRLLLELNPAIACEKSWTIWGRNMKLSNFFHALPKFFDRKIGGTNRKEVRRQPEFGIPVFYRTKSSVQFKHAIILLSLRKPTIPY